ncbi:ABC transporter ATP-binding protein [Neisseria animalis]|uniref:ABC transporter ATP-binding protein n=1 Tax=Neisseria animalis TaxID=492 RepID=A0A5P3MT98_NEIAN|nr:ABC transporter ATP-binding protein [Neisseria animalis]QEY24001.1 ABC transporter ATP-binding protein [Neisseria animalis]ROW32567.1 ABC transporter ATP-binding protein [Neisseria animalis]VEE06044.1 ABC transporter ATP-binding protein, amino acid [Neisseria animalis]
MLSVKHICKSFGSRTVAEDISMDVEKGQLIAVLGQSGCGKSTLLKIISGLIAPDSGEIRLNGENITRKPSEKRHIALMFQDYALFPHLNAVENAAFGLRMRGTGRREAEKQALQALEEVGLASLAQRRIDSLSGGEQQRLALARALAGNPKLLLLDEAFSSLDSHLRQKLRQLALAQIRKSNIPAVLVTHSPEEAFGMADGIVLLDQGRVVQSGTAREILQRPANVRAARLLGLHNADPQRYIPPNAISICAAGQSGSVRCTLMETVALPDSVRLLFRHPEYGSLTVTADWQTFRHADLANHTEVHIAVDKARIIDFHVQAV